MYKQKLQEIQKGLQKRPFLFEKPRLGYKKKEEPDDVFSRIMRQAGLEPNKF